MTSLLGFSWGKELSFVIISLRRCGIDDLTRIKLTTSLVSRSASEPDTIYFLLRESDWRVSDVALLECWVSLHDVDVPLVIVLRKIISIVFILVLSVEICDVREEEMLFVKV